MKEFILFVLSLVMIAAYFYTGFLLLTNDSNGIKEYAMLVYGSTSALAGAVVQYWFGSSKNSSDKDKAITNLTKGDEK
jgi:hypothetical protein